jgi:hypothetical protein
MGSPRKLLAAITREVEHVAHTKNLTGKVEIRIKCCGKTLWVTARIVTGKALVEMYGLKRVFGQAGPA